MLRKFPFPFFGAAFSFLAPFRLLIPAQMSFFAALIDGSVWKGLKHQTHKVTLQWLQLEILVLYFFPDAYLQSWQHLPRFSLSTGSGRWGNDRSRRALLKSLVSSTTLFVDAYSCFSTFCFFAARVADATVSLDLLLWPLDDDATERWSPRCDAMVPCCFFAP